MSKHNRDRRHAAPVKDAEETALETPEAVAPEITEEKKTPQPPPFVVGMAQAVKRRWGVPEWLTYLAAYSGSMYGKTPHPQGNLLRLKAEGTEPKTETGMAWFGSPMHGFDRFGWSCSQLGLDYSDPKDCVAKLASRCPAIIHVDYKLFYKEN